LGAALALGAGHLSAQATGDTSAADTVRAAAPDVPADTAVASRPDSGARTGGAARAALPATALRLGWDVAPFVGYAARSPVRFWGMTPGRNHLMLGVQFARAFGQAGPLTVAYAPNVVPLFVLTNNPRAAAPPPAPPRSGASAAGRAPLRACESTRCGPVYGVGAAPLGLRLETRLGSRVRVYGAAAAGLVYFSRNVPVRDARRLNATAEWGGGAVVGAASGVAAQLGFKYHHLSNAYTAARNPGVDGRVFYAGVLWRVGARDVRRGARPSRAAP
jgi:hypothetical protein